MGNMAFFEKLIDSKVRALHCAYIGKVVRTDGVTATVQPLGLVKHIGSDTATAQAVVDDVPVACKYKLSDKTVTINGEAQKIAVPEMIAAGDLVVCLCADRDITAARRGHNELPPAGWHSITDSIIVGIL